MTWRAQAAPIIAAVLRSTRGRSEGEIRKALRAAYPYDSDCATMRKVWQDEIKRQRDLKIPLGKRMGPDLPNCPPADPMLEGQGVLFEDM